MNDPVNLDPVAGHIATIRVVKAQQEELAAIRAELEQTIKDHLGDAETGTLDGTPAIRWRHGKRTALSQKLLKELYPAVFAECHEVTPTRRFEIL